LSNASISGLSRTHVDVVQDISVNDDRPRSPHGIGRGGHQDIASTLLPSPDSRFVHLEGVVRRGSHGRRRGSYNSTITERVVDDNRVLLGVVRHDCKVRLVRVSEVLRI
jgi:hypothetical protein